MKLIRIIGSQIATKIKILLFITFCLIIVTIGLGISSAVLHSQYKNTTREEEKERKRKYRNRLAIATFVFLGVLITLIIVSLEVLQRSSVKHRQDAPSRLYNKQYFDDEEDEDEDDTEEVARQREEAREKAHTLTHTLPQEVEEEDPNLSGDSEEIGDTTSEMRSAGPEKKTVIINEKSVDLLKVRCIKKDSVIATEIKIMVYSAPKGYKNYEVKLPLEKHNYGKHKNKKQEMYRVTEKDKNCDPTKGIFVAGTFNDGINIPILVKETGDQEEIFIPKVEALGKKEIDEEKDLIKLKKNLIMGTEFIKTIREHYGEVQGFSEKIIVAANKVNKNEFDELFSQNNSNLEIFHEGV